MSEETKKCPNCGWSKTYENDTSHHYNELKQELQAHKDEELDYMTIYIKGFEDGKQVGKDKEDKLRDYLNNDNYNEHFEEDNKSQCNKINIMIDILNLLDK